MRASGRTLTGSAAARSSAFAELPARSRTRGDARSRSNSSVTPCVPSARGDASESEVVDPETATRVTAGPGAAPMRTANPPAPAGVPAASSASDQVTVTSAPAASALRARGRTPSTRCAGARSEPCARRTALRFAAVTMALPAGAASASAPTVTPSSSSSPSATVYSKRSTAVPEPEAYAASRRAAPTSSASTGVPVTSTGSEKVTSSAIVASMR